MSRRTIAALVAVLLGSVLAPLAASAQDRTPPAAEWTLSDTKTFGTLSRPAVRFTHAAHEGIPGGSCLTCHHVFVNGKNVLDPATLKAGDPSLRCATCHAKASDLEARYHRLCVGCHDTAKQVYGVQAPRACGECHVPGK